MTFLFWRFGNPNYILLYLHVHLTNLTNLVSLIQTISQELDDKGQIDVIYTDFSRAFDTIDHGMLLGKLSAFGLSPSLLKLLHSYLTNRCNYVYYNGFKSFEFCPSSGVPQGSNLGPLLFVLFINDLLDSFSCSVLAYADDLKIYSSINTCNDVLNLQENINILSQWCSNFNLKLNIKKCCYVSYTRKSSPTPSHYFVGNTLLQKVDSYKDLGVLFDCHLSFSNHINYICTSASRTLGFVMRCCKYFNNTLLMRMLYFSFVVSRLEYASQVWSPHYLYLQLSIEKLQRRFLKYLSFKTTGIYPQRGVDYTLLLETHDVQSLSYRREVQGARFVWKLSNGWIDSPYLLSCLNFFIPRISSRSSSTFLLPFSRTNILQGSPLVTMCRAANLHYADIFS